jgi:hypothetical protein
MTLLEIAKKEKELRERVKALDSRERGKPLKISKTLQILEY